MYYKRPDGHEWKGPGNVIGQDGSVIFVRHGGTLIRVHQSRLQKVKGDLEQERIARKDPQLTSESAPDCQQHQSDSGSKNEEISHSEETIPESTSDLDAESEPLEEDGEHHPNDTEMATRIDPARIEPGQIITYNHMDTRTKISAKVMSKAGKATGRNKNWYNIQCLKPEEYEGERMSVDLTKVSGLALSTTEPTPTTNSDETLMIMDEVSFENAKKEELESWKKNHVYTEIEDNGQRCVSTRWVCTLKETKDEVKAKARLVVRGFEEIGKDDIPKDSPTCANESLKTILSIFAQKNWVPYSMDIKTAFLQGQEIERDIFVKPPKEAGTKGKVWHLEKCVYGLNDASLQWYNRVKNVLEKCGGTMSKVDPAVFYWMDGEELEGILACHVDDFIWGGTENFKQTVVQEIRQTFKVGKEESKTFQYIGMEMFSDGNTILLHQSKYGESLESIPLEKSRAFQKHEVMSVQEKQAYRSKIGQILWTSRQSRPDVVFDACQLASKINDGKVEHLQEANKVIRRIKSEQVDLKFHNLGSGQLSLLVYTDASLGNLLDGGTQGAYIIFLANEKGKVIPICWNSKKIRRVVRSTLAGETLAIAEGIDVAIFVSTLFTELTTGTPAPDGLPLICVTDCKSLHDALKSTKQVGEKRPRLEISGIKELMEKNIVKEVKWQTSHTQLADCLTKRGASSAKLLQVLQEGKISLDF